MCTPSSSQVLSHGQAFDLCKLGELAKENRHFDQWAIWPTLSYTKGLVIWLVGYSNRAGILGRWRVTGLPLRDCGLALQVISIQFQCWDLAFYQGLAFYLCVSALMMKRWKGLLRKTSCASGERLVSLVFCLRRTLAPLALDTRASRSWLIFHGPC